MHCEDLLLNLCRSSPAQDNNPRIPETFGRAPDLLMNRKTRGKSDNPLAISAERTETRIVSGFLLRGSSAVLFAAKPPLPLQYSIGRSIFRPQSDLRDLWSK